jgi:hypothetical protein
MLHVSHSDHMSGEKWCWFNTTVKIILSFLFVLFYLVVLKGFYLWIYRQLVGLLGWVIGPTQGLYLHTGQHKHIKMQTHIHALSRIQNCDLNIWATKDSTCLRLLGYWDQQKLFWGVNLTSQYARHHYSTTFHSSLLFHKTESNQLLSLL